MNIYYRRDKAISLMSILLSLDFGCNVFFYFIHLSLPTCGIKQTEKKIHSQYLLWPDSPKVSLALIKTDMSYASIISRAMNTNVNRRCQNLNKKTNDDRIV